LSHDFCTAFRSHLFVVPAFTENVVVVVLPMRLAVPLAVIILARDGGLVLSSFYYRYISLPPPVSENQKKSEDRISTEFSHQQETPNIYFRKPLYDTGISQYHLRKFAPPQSAKLTLRFRCC
jgi:hypothetical protein